MLGVLGTQLPDWVELAATPYVIAVMALQYWRYYIVPARRQPSNSCNFTIQSHINNRRPEMHLCNLSCSSVLLCKLQ